MQTWQMQGTKARINVNDFIGLPMDLFNPWAI
jgi:hypothetical protein